MFYACVIPIEEAVAEVDFSAIEHSTSSQSYNDDLDFIVIIFKSN